MKTEILICHTSDQFYEEVHELLGHIEDLELVKVKSVDEILEPSNEESNPQLAIQEAIENDGQTSEWIQTLKMAYPHVPVMVLYSPEDEIKTQLLVKNGAAFCLQRPFDDEFVMDAILQLINIEFSKNIPVGALEAIRIKDLIIGTEVDFGIFTHLPSNKKTIKLRAKGSLVDQDLIDKAVKGKGQQLYIMKSELPAFFSYVRKSLREKGFKNPVSMTEKAITIKKQVQQFIGVLLDADLKDFDQGKQLLAMAETIIDELGLVDSELSQEELYESITQLTERPRTNYNTMINVAVYASVFAKVSGFSTEDIHDVALAGILHNVGLSQLGIETARKNPEEMTPEELQVFHQYPLKSLNMVKAKRIPLDEDLCKVLEQHMENADGSGFPKKLRSQNIQPLAKILRLAKEFNRLTSLGENLHDSVTPTRAFKLLLEQNDPAKGNNSLDFSLVRKASKFFEKKSQEAIEKINEGA
ncbi:MAG: HD domain-containing phosphohydrolase [Bdellovibrionota bacterium]|nr:HD domain-containing phosphohydrolase [Bdellovibrionota bacterium]